MDIGMSYTVGKLLSLTFQWTERYAIAFLSTCSRPAWSGVRNCSLEESEIVKIFYLHIVKDKQTNSNSNCSLGSGNLGTRSAGTIYSNGSNGIVGNNKL